MPPWIGAGVPVFSLGTAAPFFVDQIVQKGGAAAAPHDTRGEKARS